MIVITGFFLFSFRPFAFLETLPGDLRLETSPGDCEDLHSTKQKAAQTKKMSGKKKAALKKKAAPSAMFCGVNTRNAQKGRGEVVVG